MTGFDIGRWLDDLGLGAYKRNLVDGDVTADVLPDLTAEDLRELGISSVGHRRKLLAAIRQLRNQRSALPAEPVHVGKPGDRYVERRHMTIMFCDLVGSTAMSARLDPEQTQEVVARYYDCAGHIIARHDGYVAKLLGDGILAYFGYPRAQEDAAFRSVMAAREIVRAVAELREPGGAPLACRIGTASGLVVVGDLVQAGATDSGSVFGETPNLAARLQGFADPGGVVISDSTARLLRGRVPLEDLGELKPKGFSHPVRAYRVAPGDTARGGARAAPSATPFVNRSPEMSVLESHWSAVEAGGGRSILITGDAGIGKSRLVEEFVSRIGHARPTLRFECSPYDRHTPFHPFIRDLKQACPIDETSSPAALRETLLAHLSAHGVNDPAVADAYVHMFGEGVPPAPSEARRRRDLVIGSLVTRIRHACRSGPAVALFSDIHWIDPSSLTVIDRLLPDIGYLPLLVVMTARSSDVADRIAADSDAVLLDVGPLDRRHTEEIVRLAHGANPLKEEFLEALVDRADGVPVFAEELARDSREMASLDLSAPVGEPLQRIQIPETLQESLQWRIDRLSLGREPLRVAACFGRDTPVALLDAMVRSPEAIEEGIDELVAVGLVARHADDPTLPAGIVRFRHQLVLECAYESILHRDRTAIHGTIADTMIGLDPMTETREPHILAYHLERAGRSREALDHWVKAGRQAAGRSADAEAVARFNRGLALIDRLDTPDDRNRTEADVLLAMLPSLIGAYGYTDDTVSRAIDRAVTLTAQDHDGSRAFSALFLRWIDYVVHGSIDVAHAFALRLGQMIQRGEAEAERLVLDRMLCTTFMMRGQLSEAKAALQSFLSGYDFDKHAEALRAFGVTDNHVTVLCCQVCVDLLRGEVEEAHRAQSAAIRRAEGLGHAHTLCHTLAFGGALACGFGLDWVRMADFSDRLAAESRRRNLHFWQSVAQIFTGIVAVAKGDVDSGLRSFQSGVAWCEANGAQFLLPTYKTVLNSAAFDCNGPREALLDLDDIEADFRDGENWLAAELARLRGLQAREAGKAAAAGTCFSEAIRIAGRQDAHLLVRRIRSDMQRP